MASLSIVVRAYIALQRDISNPLIQGMTTKSGRITIPLFKWMEYASVLEKDELILYEQYVRKHKETRTFGTLVGLSYGANKTGYEREFTFDLVVDGYKVNQLLAGYISESQLKDLSSASKAALSAAMNEVHVPVTPAPQKATRKCPKIEFAAATAARYSKGLMTDFLLNFDKVTAGLQEQVKMQLMREVLVRFTKHVDGGHDDEVVVNSAIVSSIKKLVTGMRSCGANDREQLRFMDSLSLAVSGNLPIIKLENATGLSRRSLEEGRDSRILFEDKLKKSEEENQKNIEVTPTAENNNSVTSDHDADESDVESGIEDENEDEREVGKKTKRSDKENIFRDFFSSKRRKLRIDKIDATEVQLFCHYSSWGGRVDTLKLSRQQVLVLQPNGEYEYEAVRSYQYTVREMYTQFIKSDYGARQRLKNKEKDLSIKRFRELICPCMTHAKQRDTADEIVAEFKHCLHTWDVNMRKQNPNVKAEIAKCRCSQHKEGSETATLYAKASKSPTSFMAYLLCPQIQREELAVKVFEGQSTFAAARFSTSLFKF